MQGAGKRTDTQTSKRKKENTKRSIRGTKERSKLKRRNAKECIKMTKKAGNKRNRQMYSGVGGTVRCNLHDALLTARTSLYRFANLCIHSSDSGRDSIFMAWWLSEHCGNGDVIERHSYFIFVHFFSSVISWTKFLRFSRIFPCLEPLLSFCLVFLLLLHWLLPSPISSTSSSLL